MGLMLCFMPTFCGKERQRYKKKANNLECRDFLPHAEERNLKNVDCFLIFFERFFW